MRSYLDVTVQFLPINKGSTLRQFYINGGGEYQPAYSPHFRLLGDDEYLGIQFVGGPDKPVNPGELVTAKVWLIYHPKVSYDKLKLGREFEILEGAQIVGEGCIKSPIYFEDIS
jgi:hypothetical protein